MSKDKDVLNGKQTNLSVKKHTPKCVDELRGMFLTDGVDPSLIDVSNVESMDYLFEASTFNGDISEWM